MSPLEQLRAILKENYVTEDGDDYMVELRPGLTDAAIDELAERLPTGRIPADIRELLRFSAGFSFHGLDGVRFDGDGFGFEEVFPYNVELAGDGFGNFWILDVGGDGKWNSVFYVCHDPAVVVKQSNDLAEFIKHFDEYGKEGKESTLDIIHERIVVEIWDGGGGFIAIEDARSAPDRALSDFASGLPDHFVIADLRGKPNGRGFAWGKFGPKIENAVRHPAELIWGFELGKDVGRGKGGRVVRKGFFSRLFGR